MKLKKFIRILTQWIMLSVIMLILWSIIMGFIPSLFGVETNSSSEGTLGILLALFAVSFINTAVIIYPVFRSRWHGVKLVFFLALVVYAVQFFLGEIEAIFFRASVKIPIKLVFAQLVGGFIFAFLFVFIAVAILGKMKKSERIPEEPNTRLIMPKGEFILKFLILSIIIYPLLYFLFGYFVAWQFSTIREFYSGSTDILPFFEFIRSQLNSNDILIFWQMARGMIWVCVALPVIRMMKGTAWEAAVTTGLIFALVMNSQHLIPNPYMPGVVRLGHFIETTSSNFIWGMCIVWLMNRQHKALPDLFKTRS